MNYLAIVWAGVVLVSIILEAATMDLVSIWFMPGALVATILALLDVSLPWQLAAFIVISVLLLIFTRRLAKKLIGKVEKTNADALIGQTARIVEEVDNREERGAAKIAGQVWTARSDLDDVTLAVGEMVTVTEIRGVKLICHKQETK